MPDMLVMSGQKTSREVEKHMCIFFKYTRILLLLIKIKINVLLAIVDDEIPPVTRTQMCKKQSIVMHFFVSVENYLNKH